MTSLLTPPQTKGHRSVANVTDDWYVVATSEELRDKPLARTLLGVPLAVFRHASGVGAVLDRCPHRNAPLSLGRVRADRLECGYHGWQFTSDGACQKIPGLIDSNAAKRKACRTPAHATREQDGFIWVYATADEEPKREPFQFPHLTDARYATIRETIDFEGSVHAVAENALDVPHTAFLHRGLFRTENVRNRIEVKMRRFGDRVEAEYIGEPRPEGVIGKVLAPGGGVVRHFDRFILPCIAQVEYEIGEDSHVVATTALTPIGDDLTRMFAAVSFRLPFLPNARIGEFVGRVLKPLALRIVGQDLDMLRAQTKLMHRFGGEQYVSTELDLLGPQIIRLLRQAEGGVRGAPDEIALERTVWMDA